jgi:hypothetical protein
MENSSKRGLINWLTHNPEPGHTAYQKAEEMLRMLASTPTPPEYSETRVLSEHGEVAMEATSDDTVESVVEKFKDAHMRALLARGRVEPVQAEITRLLDSLSEGDRDFLVRNFKYIEKKEDGVLCLR